MLAGRAVAAILALTLLCLHTCDCARAAEASIGAHKWVLVLYDSGRILPANIEGERGITDVISSNPQHPELSAEFFDNPRFEGVDYVRAFTTYLRDKYALHPPDVLIAAGDRALEFVLQNRAQLFPGTPVVYAGAYHPERFQLPPDVRGVPVPLDFIGTVEEAARLHPKATRLVVVTGASKDDREWEDLLRNDLRPLKGRFKEMEFLSGLATEDVLQRVNALGHDAIVFTPGYFQDGDGRTFTPREAVTEIAHASSAPVYGPFNTFIGTGVVGGRFATFYDMGRMGGLIANKILDGQSLAAIDLPKAMPTVFSVDWRQIKRWGIAESSIPPDTNVQFKTPGFWDQYRIPALLTIVVLILQSGLIGALLLERQRRRRAEIATERHRSDLAHASRLAIAGELTASIAHELNQPLTSIILNLDVARTLVDGLSTRDELVEVLEDIRRDDIRASELIRRLRALFSKHEVERTPLKLNDTVREITTLLQAQARERLVSISIQSSPEGPIIVGDKIQIQQVLLNVVINAIDAVADLPWDRRIISIGLANKGDVATVEIVDRGRGIDPALIPKLFDSFFSTKPNGFGLGLSIVRTIVEAHGGRVWAENRLPQGAAFHIHLPIDKPSGKVSSSAVDEIAAPAE